jgi:hypothetical protein
VVHGCTRKAVGPVVCLPRCPHLQLQAELQDLERLQKETGHNLTQLQSGGLSTHTLRDPSCMQAWFLQAHGPFLEEAQPTC